MIAENIWAEANGIPTRYEIARDLLEMPAKIAKAEDALHAAKVDIVCAKDELADREAVILCGTNSPPAFIEATNAEKRKAVLLQITERERDKLHLAEARALDAELVYNREINRFRALRAVASLIAGEDR